MTEPNNNGGPTAEEIAKANFNELGKNTCGGCLLLIAVLVIAGLLGVWLL